MHYLTLFWNGVLYGIPVQITIELINFLKQDEDMFRMKITALLGAVGILLGALSTPLMAGSLGIGLNASGAYLNTTGQETLKDNGDVQSAEEGAGAFVPSGYIQYTFGDDGFVLGASHMPGTASIGSKESVGKDHLTSKDEGRTSVLNRASAELTRHWQVYAETPGFTKAGLFAKVGWNHVTLRSTENLDTGAAYPDADINGYTYGIGFKGVSESGILVKFAGEYTDWDQAQLVSSSDDNNDQSTVTGNVEMYALKLSIGYNF